MSGDTAALFDSIVTARGGIDVLSGEQLAIAKALCVALSADPIVPSVVSQLTALLPQPLGPPSGDRHINLELLSEEDFDTLEKLVERVSIPGPAPEPDSDAARVAGLLEDVHRLSGMLAQERRLRVTDLGEIGTWQRLHTNASTKIDELQRKLDAVQSAAASGTPSGGSARPKPPEGLGDGIDAQPSSIIPLTPLQQHGLAVAGSLNERYPSLAFDPPVAR